jgi:hypothetical protein
MPSTLFWQLMFHTLSVTLMKILRQLWIRNSFCRCPFNSLCCNQPNKTNISLKDARIIVSGFDIRYLHIYVGYETIEVVKFMSKVGMGIPTVPAIPTTLFNNFTGTRMWANILKNKRYQEKFRPGMTDDHLRHSLRIFITRFPTDVLRAATIQPKYFN